MSNQESFKANYELLQNIANQLTNSQSVDIDQLVPMVDQATKAYQNCKSRLEAVEKALAKRLDTPEYNQQQQQSAPNISSEPADYYNPGEDPYGEPPF